MGRIFSLLIVGFVFLPSQLLAQTPAPSTSPSYNPPFTLTTNDATDITSNSATLNGTVVSNTQNYVISCLGFQYGTSSELYTNFVCEGDDITVSGKRSMQVNGLSPETTYSYRMYTVEKAGSTYGNEKSFVTLAISTPAAVPSATPRNAPTPICSSSISGAVIDAITGVPVEGAAVTADPGGYSTMTDAEGAYTITDILPGGYMVTATAQGYVPSSLQSAEVVCGETATVHISLTPAEPVPECPAKSLEVSQKRISLKRGETGEVIAVLGGESCFVEGETIVANIGRAGFGRVSVFPSSAITDGEGKGMFLITAERLGKGRIIFKAGKLKKTVIVRVVR